MNKRILVLVLGVFLAGTFIFGIAHLFKLRFDVGDIYPPYSSLRSDPLGIKAFYESLSVIPDVSVSRSLEPLGKIGSGHDTTLFIAGLPAYELTYAPAEELRQLEAFMTQGGRLVVTVLPQQGRDWSTRREERLKKEEAEEKTEDTEKQNRKTPKEKGDEIPASLKLKSLKKKWDFEYDYEELEMDEEGVTQPILVERTEALEQLPHSLSWYSAVYFRDLGSDWTPILTRGDKPVMVEKRFGAGSLVFASDSYFISNQALRKERHPELLAWLVGPNRRVIFNETHLGIQSDPGIAALARKYRLIGLAVGLFLLAVLFIWKNAVSLVPAHEEDLIDGTSAVVAGIDSAKGFTNLLRRSISPADITSTCFNEFKRSATHSARLRSALAEIEKIIAEEQARSARERRPVETYQKISAILAKKNHL